MSGPDTAADAVTSIDIPGQGKLSVAADANAPLLVVFGGIEVDKAPSGVYMWNYMSNIKDRFTSSLRSTTTRTAPWPIAP